MFRAADSHFSLPDLLLGSGQSTQEGAQAGPKVKHKTSRPCKEQFQQFPGLCQVGRRELLPTSPTALGCVEMLWYWGSQWQHMSRPSYWQTGRRTQLQNISGQALLCPSCSSQLSSCPSPHLCWWGRKTCPIEAYVLVWNINIYMALSCEKLQASHAR